VTGRPARPFAMFARDYAAAFRGMTAAGAVKVAGRMDAGTIVTLLPDGGWKYLSSGAWTDDLDVVEERASRINYW